MGFELSGPIDVTITFDTGETMSLLASAINVMGCDDDMENVHQDMANALAKARDKKKTGELPDIPFQFGEGYCKWCRKLVELNKHFELVTHRPYTSRNSGNGNCPGSGRVTEQWKGQDV